MLRSPKCGGIYENSDGFTRCFECQCELITEDEYRSDKPTVEYPYCHLTDTKKISGMSKARSVALYEIFAAGKVSKQWHCNECGSNFWDYEKISVKSE